VTTRILWAHPFQPVCMFQSLNRIRPLQVWAVQTADRVNVWLLDRPSVRMSTSRLASAAFLTPENETFNLNQNVLLD
jgi:hypothetical protein